MKKVILTPNPYRDKSFRHTVAAERILRECGVQTYVCLPFGADRGPELHAGIQISDLQKHLPDCDMLVCFGGDGTILHTSKLALEYEIPILGINIGTMGFMAELEAGELELLRKAARGEYSIERRMMLDVEVYRDGRCLFTDTALNDAAITKGAVARVIQVSVLCDGVEASSFSGDGVLVSTPTGSTAYSVSAGGPIVEATARNIIITPICAHTMQVKSLVTAKDRKVTVRIGRIGRRNAFLSVDGGRAFRLNSEDQVQIRRSVHETRLVKIKGTSFYATVREKLGSR